MLIYKPNIKEAIIHILKNNDISRYRLAKELNLSTATHIGNYINGVTKKCRPSVIKAIESKYGIIIGEPDELE